MDNFEKYQTLHTEVMKRLEDGEITTEQAKEIIDLSFNKYIINDNAEIVEESVFGTLSVMVGAIHAIIIGCVCYSVTNAIGGKINLKRCANILKETDDDFIDPKDMTVKRYTVKSLIEKFDKKKEIDNRALKLLYKFLNHMDVYSYKGKEIFAFARSTDYNYDITEKHLYFNLIDDSLKKYEKFYLAYACNKSNVKNREAYKWAKDFLKENDKKNKSEDNDHDTDKDDVKE